MCLQSPLLIRLSFAATGVCVNRIAIHKSLRKSFLEYPRIMAVSIKRHNEEAAGRPVDKKKLVNMPENHSKIWGKLANHRLRKKT